MKELALRQALRAARLEGMLRGESQQQPQNALQTQTEGGQAGLERLAEAIQESSAAGALSVRKGGDRKATYKLVGVDPGVGTTDIIPQLFAQNELEGQAEECAILKDFVGRGGARTVIISVPQQVGRQLRARQKVHVGWAVCAVYLSPNLPRAERRNCPACRRQGRQADRERSMSSAWCPVYREFTWDPIQGQLRQVAAKGASLTDYDGSAAALLARRGTHGGQQDTPGCISRSTGSRP
ncbi:hypothetical protein HPB48_015800 [Haemaphysalis longicornis]|uniref:Uncharacterized protein n=1 Tax=Haemaphysalis longicornis TaxID=44386 RepID=A0A9J6GJE9_HAELO|nr:hypothetical protein HPB48_015800 [Haemaphysalis longicornis]